MFREGRKWEPSSGPQMTLNAKQPGKRHGLIVSLALALLLCGGGYYGWRHHSSEAAGQAQQRSVHGESAGPPPVPVTLASAQKSSFPVYLSGLGTVQAYNTVTVRTRVDGQIEKVAFKEGQVVNAGDVLVQIDPRPYQAALEQARAKKTQDEANLSNAKADLARYAKLGEYATRQQTETQASTVAQLTAQVAADQAAIDNAETQLGYTTIQAPIAGLTGFRQVDIGNIVNAATQTGIVTITQIEPISAVFTAPEEQLQDINAALAAGSVPVAAFTTDGLKKLSDGKLELVNNQIDATSGTIRLKATFENRDHALWPGLSISTQLLVTTLRDVVTVPDDAVQHGPNGLYAFVVDDGGKARMQEIAVGPSGGGRSVVEKGLAPGQRVIVAGQYRVQPGTSVAEAKQTAQEVAAEVH
jgi:multidrug efflux system membrane fusion protein